MRERQKAAAEELMASTIPFYLRVALRAFHETFEPAVKS